MSERDPGLFVTAEPDPADVTLIEQGLSAFNVARSQPYGREPLCVLVKDAEGRTLGGATGRTDWGWLFVDCLWLPDGLRQGGLGRRIMERAEAEAMRRGCGRARLYTYSFQARGFYERLGYEVFGILDDYPPGHSQIWMRKDLGVNGAVAG